MLCHLYGFWQNYKGLIKCQQQDQPTLKKFVETIYFHSYFHARRKTDRHNNILPCVWHIQKYSKVLYTIKSHPIFHNRCFYFPLTPTILRGNRSWRNLIPLHPSCTPPKPVSLSVSLTSSYSCTFLILLLCYLCSQTVRFYTNKHAKYKMSMAAIHMSFFNKEHIFWVTNQELFKQTTLFIFLFAKEKKKRKPCIVFFTF